MSYRICFARMHALRSSATILVSKEVVMLRMLDEIGLSIKRWQAVAHVRFW